MENYIDRLRSKTLMKLEHFWVQKYTYTFPFFLLLHRAYVKWKKSIQKKKDTILKM